MMHLVSQTTFRCLPVDQHVTLGSSLDWPLRIVFSDSIEHFEDTRKKATTSHMAPKALLIALLMVKFKTAG